MEGRYCPGAADRKDIEGRSHRSVVDHRDMPMWKVVPVMALPFERVGRTLLYY